MGIQRKIQLGFLTIGILLFLSGIISSLELVRFNRATHELLSWNRNSIEVSRQMLDAVQEQNTTLLLYITDTTDREIYNSLLISGNAAFDKAIIAAEETIPDTSYLRPIRAAAMSYNAVVAQVRDSSDIAWFTEVYKTSYYNLTQAIKEFMVDIQQGTIEYTERLESNAYRASMVGIIALAGGIMLMLVFYFMINNYFIDPILKITRSLGGYINSRLPFDVHVSTHDEIETLREHIANIVEQNKKRPQQ